MSSVEIAKVSQVQPGTMKSFKASGKEILIANINGKFYAINNRCTHLGGDLSHGILNGKVVTCPRHGSRFDVTTGKSLRGPKILFMRFWTRSEPCYQVTVDGDSIKIEI